MHNFVSLSLALALFGANALCEEKPTPRPAWVRPRQVAKAAAQTPAPAAKPEPADPAAPAVAAQPATARPSTWQDLDRELALAIREGRSCDAVQIANAARDAVAADVNSEGQGHQRQASSLEAKAGAFARMLEDRTQRRRFQEGEQRRLAQMMPALSERLTALERHGAEEKLTQQSRDVAIGLTREQLNALRQASAFVEKELGLLDKETSGLRERLYLAHAYKGYWEVLAQLSQQEEGYWKAHYNAVANDQARICDIQQQPQPPKEGRNGTKRSAATEDYFKEKK